MNELQSNNQGQDVQQTAMQEVEAALEYLRSFYLCAEEDNRPKDKPALLEKLPLHPDALYYYTSDLDIPLTIKDNMMYLFYVILKTSDNSCVEPGMCNHPVHWVIDNCCLFPDTA